LALSEHSHGPGRQLKDAAPSGRLRRWFDDQAASAQPENCPTDFHCALVQVQVAPLHGERFANPQASGHKKEHKIWKITFHRLLIATQPLVQALQLVDGQRGRRTLRLHRDPADVAARVGSNGVVSASKRKHSRENTAGGFGQ
jgi:hypothetical protein